MPNKPNEDRRHHITKKSMKVTNWSEFNAGLRRRGSLSLWITEEAMAAWQAPARLTRGGQAHYSDIAIETNLLLRSAFRLSLRQAQGAAACAHRQHGLESLRGRPVAAGETWATLKALLAQAPSGGGCQYQPDRGPCTHRAGCGRPLPGGGHCWTKSRQTLRLTNVTADCVRATGRYRNAK